MSKNDRNSQRKKIQQINRRCTPLNYNAFWGHLEICKVLLANQVTKIFMKNNGLTPLHMASGTGKYEVCKILVKA